MDFPFWGMKLHTSTRFCNKICRDNRFTVGGLVVGRFYHISVCINKLCVRHEVGYPTVKIVVNSNTVGNVGHTS
jgi:hypothetical protein